MSEPKPLKRGDACPQCGDELKAVPGMTAEQHAKTYDRENPQGVSGYVDTAHPDVRAELGELHRCRQCGYATRFAPEKKKAARGADD